MAKWTPITTVTEEIRGRCLHHTDMQKFRVSIRRNNKVSRLNIEQETCNLTDLLPNYEVRCILRVGLLIDRIKFFLGLH